MGSTLRVQALHLSEMVREGFQQQVPSNLHLEWPWGPDSWRRVGKWKTQSRGKSWGRSEYEGKWEQMRQGGSYWWSRADIYKDTECESLGEKFLCSRAQQPLLEPRPPSTWDTYDKEHSWETQVYLRERLQLCAAALWLSWFWHLLSF